MSEKQKTITFGAVAAGLLLIALLTAPTRVRPDAFLDQGEPFFPDFTNPNIATTLEVIEFNEEAAVARPFKVTFKEGKWTIPSHHDYPADGKDRLAQTAAGVIGIRKDDFRSNNMADHEATGVLDPLDETLTTLKGRGKRITIRGEGDQVLADLIIGKKAGDQENLHFVRIPGQKRVYVSRVDIDISTRFEDWIEKDLLQVERDDIERLVLKDYSINERTGRIDERDVLTLEKTDDDKWKADRTSATQEVDTTKMNSLLRAIDDLNIVGVRPKPAGLSQSLQRTEGEVAVTQSDLLSLQSKGFYFARDGRLLSNEGELEADTKDGVTYTLRFGEVLYGTGEAITAGLESSEDSSSGPGENRYLFITTSFDPSLFPEPQKPADTAFLEKKEEEWTDQDRRNKELKDKHDQWQQQVEEGRLRSEELNARFAGWYYVISADSFDKIRLKRSDLVRKKES